MRAQQARTTPRNGKTPEERAQAAQEAREKHLAQVAAACAEEVKRARRVAEDMKEKKEKDEERMRQELEEKHANAEKRRQLFEQQKELRRRRNSSTSRIGGLPAVQETRVSVPAWKPRNKATAARVVQKAWREYRLRMTVKEFLELELDVEHVQAMSFEDASALMLEDRIVARTEKLLEKAHMLDIDEGATARGASVRTFLSSYLVLCHPQQVLSNHGAQEEDLINKAKVLLMEVQRLSSKRPNTATFSKSSENIESLCTAHEEFQLAFKAWKDGDTSFMVETMLLQFVELDAIWQTVKDDETGGVANDYRQGIRQNQTMLLVRLKRLAGPEKAKSMIGEAIKKRRKEDAAKKKALKSKPRATGASNPSGTSILEQSRSSLTPPSSREPVFSSKDLAQVIAPLPENRRVVHELALDRNYRIDAEKTREVRQNLRRVAFRAMRDDILNGRGDEWIVSMVDTVRDKILRTLQPGKGMHTMISEALDSKLIRQELSAGNFSHQRFFTFMGTVLPKLVSPARDAEVRAFARDDSSDVTEKLDMLFRIIDYLSLDYSNYLLQVSAPNLIAEAGKYEQTCFLEDYGPGTINLPRTKRWWKASRQSAVADLSRRPSSPAYGTVTPPATPPRGTPTPTVAIRPTADRIYCTGLIELYTGTPPQPSNLPQLVPETFHLDIDRVKEARLAVLHMVTSSTIILTAKNALKRDVRSSWRIVMQRMMELLDKTVSAEAVSGPMDTDKLSSNILTIFESAQAIPPAVKNTLSGTIRRVVGELCAFQSSAPHEEAQSKDFNHPVTRVLLSKMRTNILGRLCGGEEERKRKERSAADSLATAGLIEHVDRIRALVEEMQGVKEVDQKAHVSWLDKIREETEKELA